MTDSSIEKHERVFAAPKFDSEGRQNIIGLSKDELIALMQEFQVPPFRAKQIWHWIYQRGVQSFNDMNNIPKDMKALYFVSNWMYINL